MTQIVMKICKSCNIEKDASQFYVADIKTGRTYTSCKTCIANRNGIKKLDKLSILKELFDNGKKRCCDCKIIKEFKKFCKDKNRSDGYNAICYECSKIRVYNYKAKSKKELGSHYLKRFAIENYGVKNSDITNEILDIAKLHVQAKRSLKYCLDGLEFSSMRQFALYVNKKHGIGKYAVLERLYKGHSENECIIPESDFRSQFGGKSKGKVLVTNIDTGEKKIFTSSKTVVKELNIGRDILNKCLSTGCIRKPGRNSKNKQNLKIEYYVD